MLTGSYGAVSNMVEVSVTYDDGSMQAWADDEFGPGMVEISSSLQPVTG